ncbi:hypothetical protein MBEHAL_0849 [Halarchaeum acidiphilum MH1-52-1]|uniref:Uncharacterized protein n=1 Tax=Halarchaeum acidiphilum MH1-52-1 TaxID=1261545 RepID=U3A362_9EURY|nr:hypothetical protein [Halarchaeum acidiphilum]GAD52089.1 hypothetical protein MBEHAL_0849 [Halarchaeum acidiphilum MH1-52-1]
MNAERGRGQASLLALGVALLLVTGSLGVALALASGAFAGADRDAADARLADSLAARAVAADGPFADGGRANVLRAAAVENLRGADIDEAFPAARGHAVRVTLDGAVLAETGDASGGPVVRRLVLIASHGNRTDAPAFGNESESGAAFALHERTAALDVALAPPNGTRITAVRVDGRVVLRDPRGLRGTYHVATSRYRNASVAVEADGPLPAGSVVLVSHPETSRTAILGVRVDA